MELLEHVQPSDLVSTLKRGDRVVHRSDPKHPLDVLGSPKFIDYIGELAVPCGGPDAYGIYRWVYLSASRLLPVPDDVLVPVRDEERERKMAAIEALIEGATTEGERKAAVAALERVRQRSGTPG